MSSHTFSFLLPEHPDPRTEGTTCLDVEVELTAGYEPGDPNYGADADGNRGISLPGYAYYESGLPETCPECGHEFTAEETATLELLADEAAEEEWLSAQDSYAEDRADQLYEDMKDREW